MIPGSFKEVSAAVAATLIAVLAAPGAAMAAGPDPLSAVGKVQAVYARGANGVYLDLRAMPGGRAPASAELWVDVQFAGQAPHGRDFAVARLGRVRDVEAGDLVAVEFAADRVRAPAANPVAPLHQPTQVILLAAKHHSVAAQAFGRRDLRPAVLIVPSPERGTLLRAAYAPAD